MGEKMKKWICAAGVFLFCMICTGTVYADVIFEPQDSFYEEHREECKYVNRAFTANGPDGKVILYKSPELQVVTNTWSNGETVYISHTYEDSRGVVWGICDDAGWMPMAYMEVVYDSISFAEEYAQDIADETGMLDEQYMGRKIYLWEYPGATQENTITAEQYLPEYKSVYVDESGRSWGNIGYYYGYKNKWVCIDDPVTNAEGLYPDGAPQRRTAHKEQKLSPGEKRIAPRANERAVVWTVVLILAVTAVTAALLWALKRRGVNRRPEA